MFRRSFTEAELRQKYDDVCCERTVGQHYQIFARLTTDAVVTRICDGVVGILRMQQEPRLYYGFRPYVEPGAKTETTQAAMA